MKCYQVWFTDGSAMLVDAQSIAEAKKEAYRLADRNCSPGRNNVPIDKVECLPTTD